MRGEISAESGRHAAAGRAATIDADAAAQFAEVAVGAPEQWQCGVDGRDERADTHEVDLAHEQHWGGRRRLLVRQKEQSAGLIAQERRNR